MTTRRQTQRRAAALTVLLFAAHANAAVVTGPDGKPVRVQPKDTLTPGTPPSPGTPAGAPLLPAPTPGAPARQRGRRRADAAGGTPPPPAGSEGVTGANQLIGEKDFNTCKKFPAGKRIVKLNLKPDTELGDLIAWISSITCKQFLLPGTIPANSKKVTVVAPELITPEEAYRLFLGALDSAGLTVEHFGKFERIVETAKIKTMGGIPVYGEGADVPSSESYVTRLVRVENVDPNEVATVLGRLKGEQGDIVVFVPAERADHHGPRLQHQPHDEGPARDRSAGRGREGLDHQPARTRRRPRWRRSWPRSSRSQQVGKKRRGGDACRRRERRAASPQGR